jgi:2-polyprenyl-6-methoxyphenol hydroxylase-like FAD-dependent oxidoreductase
VILCGDAAHLMSPIGGQGMNTGWADAEFVAEMLHMIERHGACPARLLRAYDRCRRRAAATARRRAAAGMWLGTRTGVVRSLLRDLFMRHLLFRGPLSAHVGPYFAMLTIPYNTVERAPPSLWQQPSAP